MLQLQAGQACDWPGGMTNPGLGSPQPRHATLFKPHKLALACLTGHYLLVIASNLRHLILLQY